MSTHHHRARRRDVPSKDTMLTLLAQWVMSGDPVTGDVAADALESSGYQDAAKDVRQWIEVQAPRRERDGLFRRIRSEVHGRVLAKGTWRIDEFARGVAGRSYIAIYEPASESAFLWERVLFKKGPPIWRRWGSYDLQEFSGDWKKLLRILRSDIRSESVTEERHLFGQEARRRSQRSWRARGYSS